MRTAPFNIERAMKAATGEQWSIQSRSEEPPMAYFGRSADEIVGAASYDAAEAICTTNNLFPNLLADALSGEDWKKLALAAASVVVIRIPEGTRCNACSMVNTHMPSCPMQPVLRRIAELHAKESRGEEKP